MSIKFAKDGSPIMTVTKPSHPAPSIALIATPLHGIYPTEAVVEAAELPYPEHVTLWLARRFPPESIRRMKRPGFTILSKPPTGTMLSTMKGALLVGHDQFRTKKSFEQVRRLAGIREIVANQLPGSWKTAIANEDH